MNFMRQKQWLCKIILCVILLTGCTNGDSPNNGSMENDSNKNSSSSAENHKLKIHMIDVGQGDAILIEQEQTTLLIDAGENNEGDTVVRYLREQGIEKLDYVIGTHPHSDHIGGLDTVLNEFPTKKVIMPDVMHTTKTFEDVLFAVQKQKLKLTKPVVGDSYPLGEAIFTIIAPNSKEYEDLNDYSVGIKLEFGKKAFIFTGDADTISEEEMLHNGINLAADFFKLAHHGSAYSNSKAFLDAVSPTIGVVSVGKGNQYGHPNTEVLEDVKNRKINLYRTDLSGNFIILSDGESITVDTELLEDARDVAGTNKNLQEDASVYPVVYKTTSGTKYHRKDCSYLKGSTIEISLKVAQEQKLEACSRCIDN